MVKYDSYSKLIFAKFTRVFFDFACKQLPL